MLQQNKAALRSHMLEQRAHTPEDIRRAQSHEITCKVLKEPSFINAKTVFCYCSYGDEIDTHQILNASLQQGKALCLPYTLGKGIMQARLIQSMEDLHAGKFKIPEPKDDCPVVEPQQIDLCIVPCLAADAKGYRLGYGGGYYDRFLSRTSAISMILCAQSRLHEQIPSQAYDIACDIILTERQVIHLHEA